MGVRNGLGPEGMGGRYSGGETDRLATHKKGSCTDPGYVRTCWPLSLERACANISMDQNRELLSRERPNAAREEPRVNKECQWNLEAWGVRNGL